MKARLVLIVKFVLLGSFFSVIVQAQTKKVNKQTIKITFINKVNQQHVILDSAQYINYLNETFTINKLKYYISNIGLQKPGTRNFIEKNSSHLINEEDSASKTFSFLISSDNYESISFLIGVDSIKNVSGAQTDALDPLNGMFWTWNTGYIMFKMEGNSEQSSLVNKKIEYHIGGFAGTNNVLRSVKLNFKEDPIILKKHRSAEIIIEFDLNKIWNVNNKLSIKQTPVCTTPGVMAANIANNYAAAFQIINVINH